MAIVISGISLGLDDDFSEARQLALDAVKVPVERVEKIFPVKKSVDARHKRNIKIVYSVGIELKENEDEFFSRLKLPNAALVKNKSPQINRGTRLMDHRPVVIGFGPAGMFASLLLARYGYFPMIFERGADVDTRTRLVKNFWENGVLDCETNVQFGEGGAGTFSDGKLTTRINDTRCSYVLNEFSRFGAPSETMTLARPHIGSDKLAQIVKNIRLEILRLGGEIHFNSRFEGLQIRDGKICAVKVNGQDINCDSVILAIGHSARDTFRLLNRHNISMAAKAFSVGVRIEHFQKTIDTGMYGEFAGHPALKNAEYQFSYRENGRGVYTFCMCPGGVVVPAASQGEAVVTNGMSEYSRDGENANSGLVVSVDEKDFGSDPLAGMLFQQRLEQNAFLAGGGGFAAPGQTAESFLNNKPPKLPASLIPTYALGVRPFPLEKLFPRDINRMMRKGLEKFRRNIPGFASSEAFLTGVETRTSSPVRIVRNIDLQSPSAQGLYPCGEGAGYAGGIVSAAVDGVRVAQKIIEEFAPPKR